MSDSNRNTKGDPDAAPLTDNRKSKQNGNSYTDVNIQEIGSDPSAPGLGTNFDHQKKRSMDEE